MRQERAAWLLDHPVLQIGAIRCDDTVTAERKVREGLRKASFWNNVFWKNQLCTSL
jgi:hypothetical protein